MKSIFFLFMLSFSQLIFADPLTHDQAMNLLNKHNISTFSTGNCSDKNKGNCTSLDGIHDFVLCEIIFLKKACPSCPIVVTGGTEPHTAGEHSHANGYKIDIRNTMEPNIELTNSYIKRQGRLLKKSETKRNVPVYRWGTADYALEGNHWDVKKTNWGFVDESICGM